jgi:hypothetical protein
MASKTSISSFSEMKACGHVSIFMLPSFIAGFDLGIASIYAIGNGCALFFSRARYAA